MVKGIVISLGSNIDKEKNLPEAIRLLAKMCNVIAVSSIFETKPVGPLKQPNYWNAAVLVETDLDPSELKAQVLDLIEKKLKRVRTEDKDAPRTIDLDLVLYGDRILDIDEEHHIPDPDLLRHIHLAKPIADLIPDGLHPETGNTFRDILREMERSEKSKELAVAVKVTDIETDRLLC